MKINAFTIAALLIAFFFSLYSPTGIQAQQQGNDPNALERRLEETRKLKNELEKAKNELEKLKNESEALRKEHYKYQRKRIEREFRKLDRMLLVNGAWFPGRAWEPDL